VRFHRISLGTWGLVTVGLVVITRGCLMFGFEIVLAGLRLLLGYE
jgi:hypothetical protein